MINLKIKNPVIKKRIIITGLVIVFLAAIVVAVYPFLPLLEYSFNIDNEQGKTPNEEGLSSVSAQNILIIPKINVKIDIVEGKDESALDNGAWRMPQGSTPDKGSNTVITGHRWKYRPPSEKTFYLLDKLEIGDTFQVFWNGKEYDYKVSSISIVVPTDLSVIEPTSSSVATLITCTPLFSVEKRLIVRGELIAK